MTRVKSTGRPHGQAKYNSEGCRCSVCRAARAAYERSRVRRRAYGREDLVDAAPVAEHVRRLQSSGLGAPRIAQLAGVSTSVTGRLLYGNTKRVRVESARRLLSVRPGLVTLADGARVDATGPVRRLQALVALGWALTTLSEFAGWDPPHAQRMLTQGTCTARRAREIQALYDRLWATLPPQETAVQRMVAERSRRLARSRGWAPPLAWDDDTIDDPAATPELGSAPQSAVDLADDEYLRSAGVPDEQIAARMGVALESLLQARRRARARLREAS